MIRRRLMMLKKSSGGLPEGYTAVNYLQASGKQWIDTGYRYGIESDIEVKFGTYANGTLLGAQDSDNNNHKFVIALIGDNLWAGRGTSVQLYMGGMIKPLTLKNTSSLFKLTDSIGEEKSAVSNNPDYVGSQLTIYLFARHTPTGTTNMIKSQIYYCRFYENGELVCDMRPCLDADGVPCMYDLIRQQTLYNKGTGSFTWG